MNTLELYSLLEFENILNQYSGKRYHIKINEDGSISLVQVKSIGKEILIVKFITEEQMLNFLKRNVRVSLLGSGESD